MWQPWCVKLSVCRAVCACLTVVYVAVVRVAVACGAVCMCVAVACGAVCV